MTAARTARQVAFDCLWKSRECCLTVNLDRGFILFDGPGEETRNSSTYNRRELWEHSFRYIRIRPAASDKFNYWKMCYDRKIRCLKNVVYFPSVESSQRSKYLSKRTTGIGPPEMSVRAIIVVFRIFLIAPIDSELSWWEHTISLLQIIAWGNRDCIISSCHWGA